MLSEGGAPFPIFVTSAAPRRRSRQVGIQAGGETLRCLAGRRRPIVAALETTKQPLELRTIIDDATFPSQINDQDYIDVIHIDD
ncbi:hypothetical protein WA026_008979 [Henosepilachna vigintioctopunctata]|uniref:Uncharacterized protein n=1 Tax=Henosepilachna vigintioctopunctata TaxID=420089 RepID=A0AAW1V9B1_9CUCU